jgi:type II secretory pathway predicted ATPase ExeA
MALTSLRYGVETGAGFTVITGDIGAGKTTLIRSILNNLTPEFVVGLITNTHKDFGSLLEWILLSFSLDYRNMSDMERYEKLTDFLVESYAKGKRAVIIVDEAQNLELDALEKLRVISNLNADHHRILQIILSGQPEFRDMLTKPELRQLAQRITVDFHIGPLSAEEIGNYIQHRMRTAGCDREIFSKEAIKIIGEYTQGIPRLINILCNNALVYAYADKLTTIDHDILKSVISVTKDIGMLPFSKMNESNP